MEPDEQIAVVDGKAAPAKRTVAVKSRKAAAAIDVATSVNGVSSQVEALKRVVSQIGKETKKVLDCLVSGATPPDLLTGEKIVPTAARQNFDDKDKTKINKLILTLTAGKDAEKRAVEVVFDGVETPEKKNTSAKPSGEVELTFELPELWRNDRKPRFVTVNIIDPEPPPPPPPAEPTPPRTPTIRRILPATVPDNDEDDD
jgi:hypothetical protein